MIEENQTIRVHHLRHDLGVWDLRSAWWGNADKVKIEHYWSGQPAPASRHAEARLLWSDKALHVRFVCQQAEPLVVSDQPRTLKKAMGLWDRDVCELFMAPDSNLAERYFEFEAAPNGEWLDVAINWTPAGRESDWEFHSGMTVANDLNFFRRAPQRRFLTTTMRIPWNHWIHKPEKGERWRVNLFRCVGKDPDRGYLAWQPTRTAEPNFHVPQVFGWLLFV
ncbi:MAG TPA: carbohydrate-binding family 9-like protein [Pyrinomonadaceae bacterium]|jgi:hypothetical protein|nr:carbohydrate-binding family 9-like protein [Pyrinomonadaceae bacterium]